MAKAFINWNLNNKVKFKLPQTQEMMKFASENMNVVELEEMIMSKDADGWYTMQAWHFFSVFGEKFYNGSDWSSEVQIEVGE